MDDKGTTPQLVSSVFKSAFVGSVSMQLTATVGLG
jgi:hypothetical protein